MSEAPAAKETEHPGLAAPDPSDGIAKPSAPEETSAGNSNVPAAAADNKQAEENSAVESTDPVQQEAPPLAKPTEAADADKIPKATPDQAAAQKIEAAEDASVKMLAANLDAPSEGTPGAEPLDAEADNTKSLENGASSAAAGEKRKAEDSPEANGNSTKKKAVVEETSDSPATNGSALPRKPGRPKKEKRPIAPVGRTARRTRSQGAADV
ncbi:hypothetical protein QBC47DRAFT_397988 [Echria macrotheca]|uniref:Uncharacterized protein n=1 Tax=Echria macrotheca TaxID=438768 RepID=A0AAJ0BJ11_9PEZI|nr:hypothetical protein QBC47DRAFT_397988 [Echria macrotheca]